MRNGHFIEKCKQCNTVISQCRCMDCNKIKLFSVCEKCKIQYENDSNQNQKFETTRLKKCRQQQLKINKT